MTRGRLIRWVNMEYSITIYDVQVLYFYMQVDGGSMILNALERLDEVF